MVIGHRYNAPIPRVNNIHRVTEPIGRIACIIYCITILPWYLLQLTLYYIIHSTFSNKITLLPRRVVPVNCYFRVYYYRKK